MAFSIYYHGIRQPLRVYLDEKTDRFFLIDGHRRFFAAYLAHNHITEEGEELIFLPGAPAKQPHPEADVLVDKLGQHRTLQALELNLHKDLTLPEQIRALLQIADQEGRPLLISEVQSMPGCARAWAQRLARLSKLRDEAWVKRLLDDLECRRVTMTRVVERVLFQQTKEARQEAYEQLLASSGAKTRDRRVSLSSTQTEVLVRHLVEELPEHSTLRIALQSPDPVAALLQWLRDKE